MKSIYISYGSEFADLEALHNFSKFNDCADLTVLLFTDVCSAKTPLKHCFRGVKVIICPYASCEAVGIYDSSRCDREYALKKVTSFARYLLNTFERICKSDNHKKSGKDLNHYCRLFIFDESVRVTCNITQWETEFKPENTLAHTAYAEIEYPEGTKGRFPSILSGSLLSVQYNLLKEVESCVGQSSLDLPCMKRCSCLVDIILHKSIKLMYARDLDQAELKVSDVDIYCELNSTTNPRNITFTDISKAVELSRIITSAFRFLPEKNVHISNHAICDKVCKVGIIASDSEHAVVLNPLVKALAKRAVECNPELAGIRYKVYVMEKMGKYYHKHLNKVKVTFSTMDKIAGKCKYVVFMCKKCVPMLDFFTAPSWMNTSYAFFSSSSDRPSRDCHMIQKMTEFMNKLVSCDDTSPVNNPSVPMTLSDALECQKENCGYNGIDCPCLPATGPTGELKANKEHLDSPPPLPPPIPFRYTFSDEIGTFEDPDYIKPNPRTVPSSKVNQESSALALALASAESTPHPLAICTEIETDARQSCLARKVNVLDVESQISKSDSTSDLSTIKHPCNSFVGDKEKPLSGHYMLSYTTPSVKDSHNTDRDEEDEEDEEDEKVTKSEYIFNRNSLSRKPIANGSNRFILAKKYRQKDGRREVVYATDKITKEPIVSTSNPFGIKIDTNWYTTVMPHPSSNSSTTASTASFSYNLNAPGGTKSTRTSTLSTSSYTASTASTAATHSSDTNVAGCRKSCYSDKNSSLVIDLANLSLCTKPSKITNERSLLRRASTFSHTSNTPPTVGEPIIQQSHTFSLRRNRHKRISKLNKNEITPIESALIEIQSNKNCLKDSGDCWVVKGSRLTELLLLLQNTPLIKFCKFTATDGCKSPSENVRTLFDCMKVYLTLSNRWNCEDIVPISMCSFESEESEETAEDKAIAAMGRKVGCNTRKHFPMDVTIFSIFQTVLSCRQINF